MGTAPELPAAWPAPCLFPIWLVGRICLLEVHLLVRASGIQVSDGWLQQEALGVGEKGWRGRGGLVSKLSHPRLAFPSSPLRGMEAGRL